MKVYVKTLETLLLEGWDFHPTRRDLIIRSNSKASNGIEVMNSKLCGVTFSNVSLHSHDTLINRGGYYIRYGTYIKLKE
jgi:hypothetical protein